MSFLELLLRIWNGFLRRNVWEFSPNDPITSFLQHTSQFSRTRKRIKSGVFLPRPNTKAAGRLETSVFLISNLSESQIWRIGEIYVAKKTRTIHGRADLPASAVEKAMLTLVLNNIPPRHANILGWPPEKDSQKELALELAEKSELRLHA
jgi:hypothetical protein